MKVLLIATLLISVAFANDDKGAKLEEIKSRIAANIDQRIALQNKHKNCVQSAATKDALKSCQQAHREAMQALKQENKGERSAMKAEWKAKKEAKKAEKVANKKQ